MRGVYDKRFSSPNTELCHCVALAAAAYSTVRYTA